MRYLFFLIIGLLACSNNSQPAGPVDTVNHFFKCMDQHDVECLWSMSGPKTRQIFTKLSQRLTRAHDLVYKKIPSEHRKRYIDALMLNSFPAKVTPINCLVAFLNIKGLRAPSISKDNMVAGKHSKTFTVYLPGDTTVLLVPEKGCLKMEVIGNTLLKLAFYRTLLHNLDTLDKDVSLFGKNRAKDKKLYDESRRCFFVVVTVLVMSPLVGTYPPVDCDAFRA